MDNWLRAMAEGIPRQRHAYQILEESKLLTLLKSYGATLTGTVPLGIDVEGSDLDIICEVYDFNKFHQHLEKTLGTMGIEVSPKVGNMGGIPYSCTRFHYGGWPIEIFGQGLPVERQHAYCHMVIEGKILKILGEGAKRVIQSMKAQGVKTEPAFGKLLGLDGCPYQGLLELYTWEEPVLEAFLRKRAGQYLAASHGDMEKGGAEDGSSKFL